MKLQIDSHFNSDGKEFFEYTLYDGPDGIEKVHGYSMDLILAFTKILEWRERIARDYTELPISEGGNNLDEWGAH